MRKTLMYIGLMAFAACGGADPCFIEHDTDGGSAVTCGRIDESCCIGTVNGAPAWVCNEGKEAPDGLGHCVCEPIVPVYPPDAGPEVDAEIPGDAAPLCGLLGYACCDGTCYEPYHCDENSICQGGTP